MPDGLEPRPRHSPSSAGYAIRPQLLETCWRLRAPSGRVSTCGIYRDAARGVEVRAGFSDEDLLRSERTTDVAFARELAAEWRRHGAREGRIY